MPDSTCGPPAETSRIRPAIRADLAAVVALLADDPLGASRERVVDPVPPEYEAAFAAIEAADFTTLLVAEQDGTVVGCLQLTFMPGISHLGMTRAEIEGVRVAANVRGQRIGEQMMRHAIALARARGCGLLQLTTNRARVDAQRFYERLGFAASHVGMKLALSPADSPPRS